MIKFFNYLKNNLPNAYKGYMQDVHILYRTVNLINGKEYTGRLSTSKSKINRLYLGSGVLILKAIKKYGKENFKRIDLVTIYRKDDPLARTKIRRLERLIVTKDYCKNTMTYNLKPPIGEGGTPPKFDEYSKEEQEELRKKYRARRHTQESKARRSLTTHFRHWTLEQKLAARKKSIATRRAKDNYKHTPESKEKNRQTKLQQYRLGIVSNDNVKIPCAVKVNNSEWRYFKGFSDAAKYYNYPNISNCPRIVFPLDGTIFTVKRRGIYKGNIYQFKRILTKGETYESNERKLQEIL